MRWKPSRSTQVEDRRGAGGGGGLGGVRMGGLGGGGIPLPIGGGIGGIVIFVIIIVVMNLLGGSGGAGSGGLSGGQGGAISSLDPNDRFGNFVNTVTVDVQSFWEREFQARGKDYPETVTVMFTESTQTGCGSASAATGPFYCPADGKVFIDEGFFEQLSTQFGVSGEFAHAYVIAHEYGHRVQDVVGTMDQVRADQQSSPGRANELSIRLELQADCFAGFWASSVWRTPDDTAVESITEQDIRDGLTAAAAIGDDRIQEQATGTIDKESWTHGSAEQRMKWFRTGFDQGTMESCDTFAAANP
ncbi:MAG TPA: neutral zinc metallopeptidase [Candidatus Limnocylindria bacterium]|nr:neutral zinc metallopeptidase [Candidatus Limnocylindria bacterium]